MCIFFIGFCVRVFMCVCVCVCKLEVSCVYIFHWFLLQDIYWKLYFVVMHDNYLVHMHILYIYIYVCGMECKNQEFGENLENCVFITET